jgi:GAF domain-containing protein
MSFTVFEPPAAHANEARRADAIEQGGVLLHAGSSRLQMIVEQARARVGTAHAAISIVHQDWQYLLVAAGLEAGVYSRRHSFCGHAINGDDAIFCVPDARDDERFAGNPHVHQPRGLRFYAGAVIDHHRRLPFGTLCVFDAAPRAGLSAAQATNLTALAAEVGAELRRHPTDAARYMLG